LDTQGEGEAHKHTGRMQNLPPFSFAHQHPPHPPNMGFPGMMPSQFGFVMGFPHAPPNFAVTPFLSHRPPAPPAPPAAPPAPPPLPVTHLHSPLPEPIKPDAPLYQLKSLMKIDENFKWTTRIVQSQLTKLQSLIDQLRKKIDEVTQVCADRL
jgi:hypothetical protein